MGLDITAYSQVEPARDEDVPEEYWGDFVDIQHRDFPLSQSALPTDYNFLKITEGSDSFGWRAGSYSGYNLFRGWIAGIAGYAPYTAWRDPEHYKNFPFFEVVNFSDCEGVIDHVAASNLLMDFKDNRSEFAAAYPDWLSTYDNWITGLEIAADNGILVFH